MGKQYLLGLDNGGTAVKAGLYDTQGNEIATTRDSVTQIMPKDGWLERPIAEVWQANVNVIRSLLQKTGIDPGDILGLSITGYGNGAFFFDENKKPSYPNGILSGDMRAKDFIKKWLADGTQDRVIKKTNQTLWAGQTTPIMAWFKANMPEVMANTKHVLTCKDFLRLYLTGEVAGEISDMSGISAMNHQTRQFDPEIFKELGIPEYIDMLPKRILGSEEVGGYVTEEVAKLTGLKAGTPVMGGLFDITACAISTGIVSPNKLCLILGTWSINEYISKTPIASPDFFMTSLYCMDGYYLHTEGSTTSASNLQWFVDNYMQEEAKAMAAQGKNVYDACETMLESVPYDDSSIIFLPFLFGTNVNLDAKSAFIGLSGRHTKAHMLRAVYEGIVFSHMHHIEKLYKFRDKADCARISGGGAGSAGWVQMFADALELTIEVPAAKEMGTMGVAMCVGVGAGVYKDFEEAAQVFAKVKKTYTPNPERFAYYRNKYAIYKKLIAALDGVWGQWDSIAK